MEENDWWRIKQLLKDDKASRNCVKNFMIWRDLLERIKCIYCIQEKPPGDFNKEHVVPVSYGRFKGALTLIDTVCTSCNGFFGDSLDLFLARDSLEGFLRHNYRINKKKDPIMNYHRMVVKVEEEGDWRGAFLRLKVSDDREQILVEPIDQVGFRKRESDEWVYFPLDETPSKTDLDAQGFEMGGPKSVKMLFDPGTDEDYVVETLRKRGISVEPDKREEIEWSHSGGAIELAVFATIDSWIARAIVKIALNYLAATEGKEFVLDRGFDGAREFVRYGKGEWREYIAISQVPILKEDQMFRIRQTRGHLIVTGWKGNSVVFVRLSLFNLHTYNVTLCRDFGGVWRRIACGHHFDVDKLEVAKLQNVRSSLLP